MGSGLCPISGNLNFSQFGLPTFLKSPFRDSCRVVEDPQKYDGVQDLRVIRIELPLESRVKLRLWGAGRWRRRARAAAGRYRVVSMLNS